MTYLISFGPKNGRTSHGRASPNDALQFAYSMQRMGETKIMITDGETGVSYSIEQFERLLTQTPTFDD